MGIGKYIFFCVTPLFRTIVMSKNIKYQFYVQLIYS